MEFQFNYMEFLVPSLSLEKEKKAMDLICCLPKLKGA